MASLPNNPKKTPPLAPRFLGTKRADSKRDAILAQISRISSLALPPLCLPDIHVKDRTEGPCSFAAATTNTIIPDLTAPSVGCGMGIVATTLTESDLTPERIESFYRAMRSHLGPRYGKIKNILLWLGIINRPPMKYDLSTQEFEDIIRNGGHAAIKKYKLPEDTLTHLDQQGSYIQPHDWDGLTLNDVLPRISYRSGRHDIGYGFKGNHFLEIQVVDELFDEATAQAWNLTKGQVVVMYHGGGGAVSYHIGRYFGNRKKNTWSQKIVLALFKMHFHFRPSHIRDWAQRARHYFFPLPFMELSLSSREGKRLWLATQISQNYSSGFRMGIYARVRDSLHDVFGANANCHLVWDAPHNSIMRETLASESLIIHRHTANPARPNIPVLLSGYNTTHSILARGKDGASQSLNSSDHGAGETILRARKDQRSHEISPIRFTSILQTRPPHHRAVPHESDEGLYDVATPLVTSNIIAPVVSFRPIAVFKG